MVTLSGFTWVSKFTRRLTKTRYSPSALSAITSLKSRAYNLIVNYYLAEFKTRNKLVNYSKFDYRKNVNIRNFHQHFFNFFFKLFGVRRQNDRFGIFAIMFQSRLNVKREVTCTTSDNTFGNNSNKLSALFALKHLSHIYTENFKTTIT